MEDISVADGETEVNCNGHHTSFEYLPDEMLSKLFNYLQTKDLLETCRLVSNRWKNVSTEMCRQRFVRIKELYAMKPDVFTHFENLENLPWSSYSYAPIKKNGTEFLKLFGNYIWHLSFQSGIDTGFEKTAAMLYHTPNLRRLQIKCGNCSSSPGSLSNIPGRLNLSKLKHLEIDVLNNNTVQILEYIIVHLGARLDSFKTRIQLENLESLDMVVSFLNHIPYIALEFNVILPAYDFKILAGRMGKLRIKELHLSFFKIEMNKQNYESMEYFLSLHCQHLEKLIMITPSSVASTPFKLPILPSLKYLKIQLNTPGFLSLLQSNQFPILKEVHVVYPPGIPLYFPFSEDCHIDSVSKLTFDSDGNWDDGWSRIFPNFTIFNYNTSHNYSPSLVNIFGNLKLEHLTLKFGYEYWVDICGLLSGIPNAEVDSYEQLDHVEMMRKRRVDGLPSILDLKNLKTLDIHVNDQDVDKHAVGWLSEEGVDLYLLQLQPLDLTLKNVEVSEVCEAKLQDHHLSFTILQSIPRRYYEYIIP